MERKREGAEEREGEEEGAKEANLMNRYSEYWCYY